MSGYLPAQIDLTDRSILIVGGGLVALQKVEVLLALDAEITILAPQLCRELEELVGWGDVQRIARAFQRDPGLPSIVGQIIMMGGSMDGVGNVTPAAEFNMYCDPSSARAVFRSRTTKTLIPLNVTSQVVLGLDFVKQLPDESTRAGAFLRRVVPFAFRAYRQELGLEGIHLHDAVALVAAVHPELFDSQEMAGDVETAGEITTGTTVFDRRQIPSWRPNMEVAMDVDVAGVMDCIARGLEAAGRCT